MNRRDLITGMVPSIAGLAGTSATPKHWLDSWSSRDIVALVAILGHDEKDLRRAAKKHILRKQKAARREVRAGNEILWHGVLTDSIPEQQWRTVRNSTRHDVRVCESSAPLTVQGIEIPAGSRILVDRRVTEIAGASAEIIRTADGQVRLHIWRGRQPAAAIMPPLSDSETLSDADFAHYFDQRHAEQLMADSMPHDELPTISPA